MEKKNKNRMLKQFAANRLNCLKYILNRKKRQTPNAASRSKNRQLENKSYDATRNKSSPIEDSFEFKWKASDAT